MNCDDEDDRPLRTIACDEPEIHLRRRGEVFITEAGAMQIDGTRATKRSVVVVRRDATMRQLRSDATWADIREALHGTWVGIVP